MLKIVLSFKKIKQKIFFQCWFNKKIVSELGIDCSGTFSTTPNNNLGQPSILVLTEQRTFKSEYSRMRSTRALKPQYAMKFPVYKLQITWDNLDKVSLQTIMFSLITFNHIMFSLITFNHMPFVSHPQLILSNGFASAILTPWCLPRLIASTRQASTHTNPKG